MLRRRWHAEGGGSDCPLDRLLDLAEATVSVGVRELCCRLGIAGGSFARSAENLKRAAMLSMSQETLRVIVESEGKAVLAASQEEQLEIDWSAAQCQTADPTGEKVSRIYVSADGVMVPVTTDAEKRKHRATVLRKRGQRPRKRGRRRPPLSAVKKASDQRWKQIYLSRIYDHENRHRLVSATRGNHKAMGKLLRREAARVRLKAAQQRIGLVDGAVCLRTHMQGLPLTAVGLDFYHLSEHVNQGRRDTFGEESSTGKQWADRVLHTVRHEGYEPFWNELVQWRGRQRGQKRKAADNLLHYTAQRHEMLAYDQFDRNGWHVGTGPMEAMCKATTRRIKGAGMRWDIDHAEAMMALECLYQSDLWDRYWTKAVYARN
jgi:hypothetical protein